LGLSLTLARWASPAAFPALSLVQLQLAREEPSSRQRAPTAVQLLGVVTSESAPTPDEHARVIGRIVGIAGTHDPSRLGVERQPNDNKRLSHSSCCHGKHRPFLDRWRPLPSVAIHGGAHFRASGELPLTTLP